MKIRTSTQARKIKILNKVTSAIQDTLHLVSIPGMRSSIKKGMKTPIKKCAKEIEW